MLGPSREHIIPLSLGGSNQFVTCDVSRAANNRAGAEIDDAVASLFPFLMLRHQYDLAGNRGGVPDLVMRGRFGDLQADARVRFSVGGKIEVAFEDEQKTNGELIEIASTEDRVRFLVRQRLIQARSKGLVLATPDGEIGDEDDVEVALMLKTPKEGREFRGALQLDLASYRFAVARLALKIALGLGHRVLGPAWSRGAGAHRLRMDLFRKPGDPSLARVEGSTAADLGPELSSLLGVYQDHHVMAVIPGKKTKAIISLFGSEHGTWIVDLGFDPRRVFARTSKAGTPINGVFAIPLVHQGSRPLIERSWETIAAQPGANGMISRSRARSRILRGRAR